jgi:hypothetical protein
MINKKWHRSMFGKDCKLVLHTEASDQGMGGVSSKDTMAE